jgi:starch synthase
VTNEITILARFENLNKIGIEMSDAVIKGSGNLSSEMSKFLKTCKKPVLDHQGDDYIDAFSDFYDEILSSEEVLS